jgi:hypothetical protein
VHVAAHLDPGLSRWQWLVKWLLAVPHYLVLAFLWVAFVVLSVVAFVAILFTGRYPRGIFEFNVGVLRWSWRVAYYAYGALGTDRYPPFSLGDRPDYPAHLEIDYPEHLSRGLVLVKWWLLAIPHYLVLGLFLGGAGYAAGYEDAPGEGPWVWSSGLIGLLVCFAAVALLFTGRYPQPVFDFVLGMNRWVLRVAAYAALMTDRYPPFRLDQGGEDPGTAVLTRSPAAPAGTAEAPAPGPVPTAPAGPEGAPTGRRVGWTTARVVGVVVASLLTLTSLGFASGGAALAVADAALRDDAGFLMSGDQRLTTQTYALTSDSMEVYAADAPGLLMPDALLGDVKVAVDSDSPVFVGIAPTSDVQRYLSGVRHETVMDLAGPPEYRLSDGGAPTADPQAQDFWVAQTSGSGEQAVTWQLDDGDWTVVVMNTDAGPGLDVDVAAGAEIPALSWLAPLLLAIGATGLVIAAVWLTVAISAASRR